MRHASSARELPPVLTEVPALLCPIKNARERASREGMSTLSNASLLSLILGTSVHESRGPLLNLSCEDQLHRLARLPGGALRSLTGLTEIQATRLAASFELGRRAERDAATLSQKSPLTHSSVSAWAKPRLSALEHEEVWVLCVDSRTVIKSTIQVGRGGMHGCGLLARDILTPIVREGAAGFVLVHNHPSGDPTPSREDQDLTRSLAAAAMTLCIPLLDHVVVARGGSVSFFERGLL